MNRRHFLSLSLTCAFLSSLLRANPLPGAAGKQTPEKRGLPLESAHSPQLAKKISTGNLSHSAAYTQAVKTLLLAARAQIGVTINYQPAYVRLAYPNGDISRAHGVCTDVIIRAYRDAFGYDLQKMVHEDMQRHFAAYPKQWGLKSPDPNIDHRRVPNLQTFFTRQQAELAISTQAKDYQAGDIITQYIDGKLPHIAFVSERKNPRTQTPLVIHNIGQGTREEDSLFAYPMSGHYRFIPYL